MAYVKPAKRTDDDDKPSSQYGSSFAGGGAGGSPAESQAQGTDWVNLNSFLGANEGQGAGIANAITKKTQEDVDAIGGVVNDWERDAKKRVDENTKQAKFSEKDLEDPAKIDKNAWDAWKGAASYSGPNQSGLDQGYGQVYNRNASAKESIQNANDPYAQRAMANNTFGENGSYTNGMGMLDSFLMRADKSGKQALKGFQEKNANFGTEFDAANKNVQDYMGGAKARGEKAHSDTMGLVKSQYDKVKQGVTQRHQTDVDNAFTRASEQTLNKFRDAGVKTPMNTLGYLSPEESSADAYYEDAEISALNALAGLDDDAQTSEVQRSGKKANYNVDWDAVLKDIESQKKPAIPSPKDTTSFSGKTIPNDANGTSVLSPDYSGPFKEQSPFIDDEPNYERGKQKKIKTINSTKSRI